MKARLAKPWVLLLLVLVLLALYLYRRYQAERKRAALRFSSVATLKKTSPKARLRLHLPFLLLLTAMSLIIFGLADPLIPLKTAKEGVNVVLVIDGSGSMAAADYRPTRLEAAKTSAETLIKALQPVDNVGIVIFESGATTASYLTPYKDRAIEKLRAIRQREGKTALGDGLSLAVDMATSIPNKKKVIILLSDGVNNAGVINPREAVEYARANNIQVYTVGMGSEKPVVLGYDIFGNPQYAELDKETLRYIAERTGARYYESVDERTLDEIYSRIGENIEREWEDMSIKDWFYALALAALLFYIYIVYVRYRIIV